MNRLWRSILPLCVFMLALVTACSKQEDRGSISTYRFTNTLPQTVMLDFYESREDYANCQKVSSSYQIKPRATAAIPLEALKTYWLDWYSVDYGYTNWGDRTHFSNETFPVPELTIAALDDEMAIQSHGPRDTARAILLNGNEPSSVWKATITDENLYKGTHKFRLNKDLSAEYEFTSPAGTRTLPISYFSYSYQLSPSMRTNFRVFLTDDMNEIANMEFAGEAGVGRDSLRIFFPMSSSSYWAIRQ